MTEKTYSQSRIAKNTVFLYIRMFITMGVSLFTSRVVLDVLGFENYGIYNIIGGIVVLLSIVSNSMTAATQRFLTFELGSGNLDRVSRTFSMSMVAHLIICFAILLLGETLGLWYVSKQLNIPAGRESAAMWVYQLSLLTIFVRLIQAPYNASVIAYEKMSFYAYISIADVMLKLVVVYILVILSKDKLIVYGFLVLCVTTVIFLCYRIYCKKKFDTCRFRFIIDKSFFKELFSYLGWNLLGSGAALGSQQAGNLIINKYLGVAVNAAYGVSSQVSSAINSFVSNFQVAFTPQLVKLFSQKNMEDFWRLSKSAALLSYYLLFIISFPIIINIDYLLGIWLVDVPQYSGIFCTLMIVYALIDSVQAPLWIGINASGNIKIYEIWLSILLLLNIPFSIWALKAGMSPYWVLIIRVCLNFITAIIRCIHVKYQFNFPIIQYLKEVILRVISVSCIPIIVFVCTRRYLTYSHFWEFCISAFVCVIFIAIVIFFVGIGDGERKELKRIILNKLH